VQRRQPRHRPKGRTAPLSARCETSDELNYVLYRGVADGQVGPVLTGPLFGQTEIFSLAKVYFTHGVRVLASVQFDLNSATERPTAAAACPVI